MKYFGLFCVLLSVCGVCHSAIIHRVDEDTNEERNFQEEQSLLATGVPDNTLDRNRDDQSDPRYPISEDHRAPLDDLAEAQGELPEETIKEKRCKTEEGNLVRLALKRRDTTANLLRKSCNSCMKSPLCAQKGKCESCKKICEKYGDAVDQSGDELPINEDVAMQNDQPEVVGVPSRLSNSDSEEGGLSLNDNRYYTMGAFPPGPIHSLLAKLLNIKDIALIEELVIVAKTKSNKPIKSVRPVVIDTAHVFTLNRGAPSKLDMELHKVDKGDDSVNAMATKLDKEIEKAMEEKQKLSGTTHLAPREIDRIIMNTLGKDSKQKPSIFSRTISEQDENIQSENEEEDVEKMSPQLPNKQRIDMMGADDTFQRLVAHDEGRTAPENHANHQAPIEMMDDLTGQQAPVHPDSEIVTEKITTTTKHSKRPHGPSNAEASSSKPPKTTAAPVVSTTKRLKPSPGPESPIHPDSPIKTTTSVPTTIHSNFPHGPKKQDKKKSETATSSAKTVATSDATTTHADKALTGQIDVPSRRSDDESNDPSDLPHHRPNNNFNERMKSLSKLRQMAAQDQEFSPRNVDIDSSETIEDEIRIVDQPNDKNQAFNSFVVGESMDEPNAAYEEKYKKLRAWVDENARMRPPNSVEDTKENLSSNAKEVIDGILTKIDKHLSDITKIRDMPQFGNRNGDKNLEHAPPNRNEFAETRMSPETARKIDEIFARERPMNGQRLSKKLYETHPRSKAAYDEGKWVYKKVPPKRPPYETKHRASSGRENMGKMESDDQMMAPGSVVERFQQAQLPEHPGQTSPQYLDPVFADRASEPQHSQETVPTGPVQQSKKITFIDDDPNSTQDHVKPASRGGMSESWSNADSLDSKNTPQEKNEPDDTVACSKEKDEDDDMFKIMHLPLHAMSHGYYRESEDEDGKNDRPFAHHKHRHHETPKHKQSENPLKQITEETQEMISDLNKKHKHGKTEHPHENESHPREDSGIAMHEQNGKHEYFPQDQNHRFSVPNYPGSMKAAEDMQEDVMPGGFMEEPMFVESDSMDQDMIGSPAMRTGLQEPLPEDLTHLGRFIPRGKEHSISVHSRDVSEQEKNKNMYFIGDGIKLPLNMREHHDGSLHLSVDVKSLCNCKHCISRKLENGTVIIEAMPLTEQEQHEHEMETQHPTIKENAATSGQTNTNKSSEEDDSFEESDNASHHSESKAGISKRSLRAIRSLLDNEVDSKISKLLDRNDGSEISTPMHSLTREEITHKLSNAKDKDEVEDKQEDSMKSKLKIFTNVFDFMKNLMLDIESKT